MTVAVCRLNVINSKLHCFDLWLDSSLSRVATEFFKRIALQQHSQLSAQPQLRHRSENDALIMCLSWKIMKMIYDESMSSVLLSIDLQVVKTYQDGDDDDFESLSSFSSVSCPIQIEKSRMRRKLSRQMMIC